MVQGPATLVACITCMGMLCDDRIGQSAQNELPPANQRYTSPVNGSGFWGLRSPEYSVQALLISPVAVDLDLSDGQLASLKAIYVPIAQKSIKLLMRLRTSRLEPHEEQHMRAEHAALSSELNEAMVRVLNTDQRKRLNEIALQVAGPSALFTESRYLHQLGLGGPDTNRLKRIVAEMWVEEADLMEGFWLKRPAPREIILGMERARERAIQRIIGILKPSQIGILNSLLGEPYDMRKLRPDDRYLTPVSWWHGPIQVEGSP